MEVAEFQRVLNLGLGRAILHLQKNPASRSLYRDAILYACLNSTVYDAQVESKTMDYLMEAIELTGTPDYFRTPILDALKNSPAKDIATSWQLFALAACFGKKGDDEAKKAVREKFAANAAVGSFTGDHDVIELDGLDGLLFVAHHLGGKKLVGYGYIPDLLVKHAEELFGSDPTWQALTEAAAKSGRVKAFVERVQRERERFHPEPDSRREKAKQIAGLAQSSHTDSLTYDKIADAIDKATPQKRLPLNWWHWVRRATDLEIERLAEGFLQEDRPYSVLAYLEIFEKRQFPLNFNKLVLLAENSDGIAPSGWIANRAVSALAIISHPSVRSLALRMIENATRIGWAVELLSNNFQADDWQLIAELTQRKLDTYDYHVLGLSVERVFKANSSLDAVDTLVNLYNYGPCSLCRNQFVELLHQLNKIPDWMLEEYQYDSNPHLRARARQGFVSVEEKN